MSRKNNDNVAVGLSEEQKRHWDHIIKTLWTYFETPEGEDFYERFAAIFENMHRKAELPLIVLSHNETKAYGLASKKRTVKASYLVSCF